MLIDEAKAAEVEGILRQELIWLHESGGVFDAEHGACRNWQTNQWTSRAFGMRCNTCAVGAMMIHRQPKSASHEMDFEVAARIFDVPRRWMHVLYRAVDDNDFGLETEPQANAIGGRLRAFADELFETNETNGKI